MEDAVVYLNFNEGAQRVMGNVKLYVRLLAKFRDGTNLNALSAAFEAWDAEMIKGELHTLKGLAANLSLTKLFSLCLELETQAKDGTLEKEQLETVQAVFDQTLQEINKALEENG